MLDVNVNGLGRPKWGRSSIPLAYFPQVEEAIWSEFSGVRGYVPIEGVLQTHALDEMIDQRQGAQAFALQDEANH